MKKVISLADLFGAGLGLVLWFFIFQEGRLFGTLTAYESLIKTITFCIGGVVFVLVLRWFHKKQSGKLAMYYLLAIAAAGGAALFVAWSFCIFSCSFLDAEKLNALGEEPWGPVLGIQLMGLLILVLVLIFLLVFSLFVNKKVKYLQYLAREVKLIEEEGFGRTLEVRGDDEIAELCSNLNHMSLALAAREKEKNELITNVSHDLRSPLTSIIGYVDLLKENGNQDMDRFYEYIDVVSRRLDGLNVMINELFEYTRLASPEVKLDLQQCDMTALLRHLFGEWQIIYQRSGFDFDWECIEEPCQMRVDTPKLVRVMQNLLENGRRYALPFSTIRAKVYLSSDKKEFCIEISNEIEEGTITEPAKLFDRFYKGDEARSETLGSGLGLSIVKQIAVLHGGSIASELSVGEITFVLQLPIEGDKS